MASQPDHAEFDRAEILAALDRHEVEYLLVGGVATIAHGATRFTYDFDCMPEDSSENLDRLAAALVELGARLRAEGLDDDVAKTLPLPIDGRWLSSMEILTLRTDRGDLDVLNDMPASDGTRLRYAELAGRAEERTIDGFVVRVANLDDIIASKIWADRPKDRDALPELRRLSGEARGRWADHDEEERR
ncbi:MAG: nucleotidyl transferase AbiEii/AbiGii toxin family protein [Desertimonas sp.]